MAPESLDSQEYSERSDSFSFSICLYEMVSARTMLFQSLSKLSDVEALHICVALF